MRRYAVTCLRFHKNRHIELSNSLERLPSHFIAQDTGPEDLPKVTPSVNCRDGKPGIPILIYFLAIVFFKVWICTTICKIIFLGMKDNFGHAQISYIHIYAVAFIENRNWFYFSRTDDLRFYFRPHSCLSFPF